jgi:hypothetical protein
MKGHLSIEARGRAVVLELDDRSVTLTPKEAQRFAFQLARAYMLAGEIERTHAGNIVLRNPQ